MTLLNRSLFAALAYLCSQTVGSAQLPSEVKELGSKTPKVVPSHPSGFSDIAPYLSADGAQLSFYDTREIMGSLDGIVSILTKATLQQAAKDESARMAAKWITLIYENSGVKSLAAVGSSSVPRGNQLYYNRQYIARTAGDQKAGFLWNSLSQKSERLSGLDLLPATTAFASFWNVDVAYLDTLITQISAETGNADGVKQWKQGMEKSGVKWEEILASLDNEVGVVVLLDPKKTITVPPMAAEIPHLSGGILLRTKTNYLYDRIKELSRGNGPKEEEVDGVQFLSQAVPNPTVPDFAPTIALVDRYLVIGSSREFPLQLAATLRGNTPGLLKTEEFKLLSQDVPLEGSAFTFASKSFCDSLHRMVDRAIAAGNGNQPEAIKQVSKVMTAGILPSPSFTVFQRIGADWLVTSNGPQSTLMGPTASVATVSMLSSIAVPNFLRARTRAQATQVLENARILDAAVDQYAIENNRKGSDRVEFKDVIPYLKKDSQLALSGGKDLFGRPFIFKTVDDGIRIHPETVQQFDKSVVPPGFFGQYAE